MNLEELRNQIDTIDNDICRLFEQRLAVATQVAEFKKSQNLPILNTAREREIIDRVTKEQDDAMAGYTKILFSILFDLSRTHQSVVMGAPSNTAEAIKTAVAETPDLFPKSAVVACQGMEGSNSMLACEKLFSRPSIMYFNNFNGVFNAVDKGLCKYGILPIENSLHGSVTEAYDLMKKHHFHIVRSVKVKINHVLLAKPGTKLSDIKVIYSHEQALAQCSEFLKEQKVRIEPCENTAIAAKMVFDSQEEGVAAISGIGCAELYNLEVIHDKIQNSENNYTKFICISKQLEIYPGAKRISLMMTIPHKPGALYHLMAKFAALGINLTKLESRPLPDKDFEFMFYFDLDISVYDDGVYNIFSQLENGVEKFVFLGCYSEL